MSYTSSVSYLGNLRTKCVHLKSNASFNTDAPVDNNGKGELFSPTDTVATALASCIITVMGIKAEQNQISFSHISAQVEKIMASNPRRISEIRVELHIQEHWTEKDKKIMEKTARTCPVANSLHPAIKQTIQFVYTTE